jgi:acetolactate decarboxylase
MGIDAGLAAAVTLRRQVGPAGRCSTHDAVFQLSLAHVLLDGGYDAVATLGEVLPSGDHGLGTVDRLDGELVVVDGQPWRVDSTGRAELLAPDVRTPFIVLTTMASPVRRRVSGLDRAGVIAAVEEMVPDVQAVVAVRLEGKFQRVLVRSVPAQSPPYRPYSEVCATDEVRWFHERFSGVFVGFRFPDVDGGDVIGGLHLHGLDDARSTGGHNHDLFVEDAELTVDVSHEVALALPDRSMLDLLELPAEVRAVQRALLRRGALTVERVAAAVGTDALEAQRRLTWLADRGFAEELGDGLAGLGGEPRWRIVMRGRANRIPERVEALLADL